MSKDKDLSSGHWSVRKNIQKINRFVPVELMGSPTTPKELSYEAMLPRQKKAFHENMAYEIALKLATTIDEERKAGNHDVRAIRERIDLEEMEKLQSSPLPPEAQNFILKRARILFNKAFSSAIAHDKSLTEAMRILRPRPMQK